MYNHTDTPELGNRTIHKEVRNMNFYRVFGSWAIRTSRKSAFPGVIPSMADIDVIIREPVDVPAREGLHVLVVSNTTRDHIRLCIPAVHQVVAIGILPDWCPWRCWGRKRRDRRRCSTS